MASPTRIWTVLSDMNDLIQSNMFQSIPFFFSVISGPSKALEINEDSESESAVLISFVI